MPVTTLLVAGTSSIVTGLAFGYVALAIQRRLTSPDTRLANLTLSTWWGLLGIYLALHGALTVLAGYSSLSLEVYLALRIVMIPLLCGSVASLVHHLVFIYTGNPRLSKGLAAVYIPITILFAYATFASPQTLHVSAWLVSLDDSAPAYALTYALVGIPPILASFAYLALLRSVKDPVLRMRIWLVSLTIASYIGSGLAARLSSSDGVKFVTLVGFGFAAAILVLVAYHPPPKLLARLQRGIVD